MAYNFFSGLLNNDASGVYSNLGDYSSIQRGSYKKLLKSYYKANKPKANETPKKATYKKNNVSADTKELTNTKKYADQLTNAATKLVGNGNKKLFEAGNEKELSSQVKSFISAYNSAVADASSSPVKGVQNAANSMISNTKAYESSLESIGITVDENNKLVVDSDKLNAADKSSLKRLLGGTNSFVGTTMRFASQIASSAITAASGVTTYTSAGSYTGLNMNNYFESFM